MIWVVCPSLGRDSLDQTVLSLRKQTFRDFRLAVLYGGPNAYSPVNEFVDGLDDNDIVFLVDDDTTPQRDWVMSGVKVFSNEKIQVATGPVVMSGVRIEGYMWGIGCNMAFRVGAWRGVGGIETRFGQDPPPRSAYRADTDFLWKVVKEFGGECYSHGLLDMIHPEPFASAYSEENELWFLSRWGEWAEKYFSPVDPDFPRKIALVKCMKPIRPLEYLYKSP